MGAGAWLPNLASTGAGPAGTRVWLPNLASTGAGPVGAGNAVAQGTSERKPTVLSLPFFSGLPRRLDLQIMIIHLTRMQKGFMCAAGVDPTTRRHVRPVLASRMRTEMLACHGGPFELGCHVELRDTKFVGNVPEIEDRQFETVAARCLQRLPYPQFWQLLTELANDTLAEIFGRDLQPIGAARCEVPESHGLRSLGCY